MDDRLEVKSQSTSVKAAAEPQTRDRPALDPSCPAIRHRRSASSQVQGTEALASHNPSESIPPA